MKRRELSAFSGPDAFLEDHFVGCSAPPAPVTPCFFADLGAASAGETPRRFARLVSTAASDGLL